MRDNYFPSESTEIESVPLSSIRETPANWKLYRRPGAADPELRNLIRSIQEIGITQPLEVSRDGFILSGHRRYLAAVHLGLEEVPVIRRDEWLNSLSEAEIMQLLAARNEGQRVKSDTERLREAAARVDPEKAIAEAEAARRDYVLGERRHATMRARAGIVEVRPEGKINRTDPRRHRAEFLAAATSELAAALEQSGGSPISQRHLHYRLLQRKVRTSDGRRGHIYGSEKGDAGLLSRLLTDARSAGLIDPRSICDDTRASYAYATENVAEHIARTCDGLFHNYFSDVHAGQRNHVELLIEKNTVFSLMRDRVSLPLRVPITSQHGYGSFPSALKVVERFRASGKERLVVVYVSDLDPEGMDMPESFKKHLPHDFGVDATVVRAAVTPEQVKRYNLPPDADVKLSSTRAAGFIKEHGNQCWELDSMPLDALVKEVTQAVESFLDLAAFRAAMGREKATDVALAKLRKEVKRFVTDHGPDIMGTSAA